LAFVAPRGSGECKRVSQLLSLVGDKWTMRVVMLLRGGPRRFSAIKRDAEGISQRMLTVALRDLERDGLVLRTVLPSSPPRVEYELTTLGQSLHRVVALLGDWALAHSDVIEQARGQFDRRQQSARLPPPDSGSRVVRLLSAAARPRN
jgi:DNA-binding HxlR family transcriptional regulator